MSARNKSPDYINKFQSIKILRNNSFGLFWQPGAGKSHIVIAIGAALLDKGIQVVYMPYLEAMRQFKVNANDYKYYLKFSNRYQKTKVVIIDDFLKDKIKNGQLIKDNYGHIKGLNEAYIPNT